MKNDTPDAQLAKEGALPPTAVSNQFHPFSKKTSKKSYSSHQLLWPGHAKRYGLTPAIILGTIYWYCALSDNALRKLKKKLGDDDALGLPLLTPRISHSELSKRTGLPRSTVRRGVHRLIKLKGCKVINEKRGVNTYDLGCMEMDDVWVKDGDLKTFLKLSVEEVRVFGPREAVLLSQIRVRTSELSKHGGDTWFNAEHCQFHLNKFMPKSTRNDALKRLYTLGVLLRREGCRREYRIIQAGLEARINEYYQATGNGPVVTGNGPAPPHKCPEMAQLGVSMAENGPPSMKV
jgi:hypothetical protein